MEKEGEVQASRAKGCYHTHTGRTPTKSTSEKKVPMAGTPWETGSGEGKYQYYPGGDRSADPKEAPSAINVVVVPDVNLPKVRFLLPPDGGGGGQRQQGCKTRGERAHG